MSRRPDSALTRLAEVDLLGIHRYLLDQSVDASQRAGDALQHAMELLAENPGLGRPRPELGPPSVSFWPVLSYFVAYRPKTRPLEIVRVLHASRDIAELLANDDG